MSNSRIVPTLLAVCAQAPIALKDMGPFPGRNLESAMVFAFQALC